MSLVDTINADLKTSMKARDKVRTMALRGIRAVFIETMKADGSDTLDDAVCVSHLRKLAKSRQESIDAYTAGGREDLVEAEAAELAIIEAYLPSLANEEVTRGWVKEAIAAAGAAGPADMGKVMGRLMGAHKDAMDGKLASRLVREELAAL